MVTETSVEGLKAMLRGPVIQASDAEYETARRIFNGMIDRHPRAIARPLDAADVIASVKFARDEGLSLAVRGGGHGVAGFGTNDDGLVIDLSLMKGVRVDPERRTARVGGGCTWGDMDHATHAFGLATPGGVVSTTGVGGLSLGGGLGHLTRKCGLSCDNYLSADVVTADGSFVVANEKENSDLFWALRGGGGNFGVVTSFEFRLHEVSTVYAGAILWPLEKAADAMKFYGEFITNAPEDLNAIFAFLVVPPGPPFPEPLHNKNMCGAVVCWAGPSEKGEGAVKPLREFGPPAFEFLAPMRYPMLQTMFDPISPPGMLNYWKADFVETLGDEIVQAHAKFGPGVPNVFSGAHTFTISGAVKKVPSDETAWSYRHANFVHVIFATYTDPSETPKQTEWVRDYWSALHPYSAGGAYVNFIMDEGEDRVAASYGDNYSRLAKTKAKYDPGNLFRLNQNIRPAG